MEGRDNIVAAESGLAIHNWHAHVYFDVDQAAAAQVLCETMRDKLNVPMGRLHTVPVGPHPRGSCQMTIPRDNIGAALEWLFAHRGDFTVFVHGNSGDDWIDHTRHILWVGSAEMLNLSIFELGAA